MRQSNAPMDGIMFNKNCELQPGFFKEYVRYGPVGTRFLRF